MRPRRLDRLALTNDPNLPGLMPLSNRVDVGQPLQEGAARRAAASERIATQNEMEHFAEPVARRSTATEISDGHRPPLQTMNLRNEILQRLELTGAAADGEIVEALQRQAAELETLRNRCQRLTESQADADVERFADVITNRDVVRAQLLANRDGTLALLQALRQPEPVAPLHQPRLRRPNLHLLSPLATEPDTAAARRVANRARQLQSQLKIGHHAAFRLAEGEAAETEVA